MRYVNLILIIFVCFQGCRNKNTLIINGLIYEGYNLRENYFEDTIWVYNQSQNLLSKKVYKNNKLHGQAKYYSENGKLSKIEHFHYGEKHGSTFIYNSDESLKYIDNYFHGLPAGPLTYFESKNNPTSFFFISLENSTILHIDYKNWNGIENHINELIYYTINNIKVGKEKQIQFFLYTISPPKFKFDYTLGKRKINSDKFDTIGQIDTKPVFTQFTQPTISKDETYVIGLGVFDSILNKKSFVYKDIY